jgi:two-component system response regulator YesN
VGEIVADIHQVSNTYRGAVQALNYKLVEGDNKILWIKDLEPKRLDILVFDDIEDEMGQLIRSCDINKIEVFLKDTLDRFNHISVHIDDIKLYILELMLFLLRISREYNLKIEWFEENKDIYNALEQLSEVTLILELTQSITKEISLGILDTRKNSVKLLVESSEVYINEHYCEDISLESVADFLHISPEYLSRQFKKEKQITFIHYLTSIRLEAAKRLIQDTNKKNFEVAEAVGYKEPNYFSYVFKKHFGISPSKYRKSIKGDL